MRAIRKFACANHLDFVTVSYCQAADDARYALMLQACNWLAMYAIAMPLQPPDALMHLRFIIAGLCGGFWWIMMGATSAC